MEELLSDIANARLIRVAIQNVKKRLTEIEDTAKSHYTAIMNAVMDIRSKVTEIENRIRSKRSTDGKTDD